METKIYYYKNHFIANTLCLMFGNTIPPDFVNHFTDENYRCVYTLDGSDSDPYEYLESLFSKFNSEDNPLYASADHQNTYNDTHSSMSIGDIVSYQNELYVVAGRGFRKITNV